MSHGYTHQACVMAVELAEEMLRRPPNLLHQSLEHRYYPETSVVSLELNYQIFAEQVSYYLSFDILLLYFLVYALLLCFVTFLPL